MKILLVSPYTKTWDVRFESYLPSSGLSHSILPPMGLLYIKSFLEKHSSYQIEILDCQLFPNNYFKVLREKIEKFNPAIVGISSYFCFFGTTIKLAQEIKSIKKNIHINIGGVVATLFPVEVLKHPCVDTVTIGEGEITFLELANAINENKGINEIKGLCCRNGERITINPAREQIKNLDILPFPQHLDVNNYDFFFKKKSVLILTSRGCPFKCIYCLGPKNYRQRTVDNIISEIETYVKLGYKHIAFYDDNFNVNKNFVHAFCRKIKECNFKITWSFRGRLDLIDEELVAALKSSGCDLIHVGVEAGTETSLKFLNRGINLNQIKKGISLLKKYNISIIAYFMLGLPYESAEDSNKTIEFAKQLSPDLAMFFIIIPLPGTNLYNIVRNNNRNDYWKEYVKNPFSPIEKEYFETEITLSEARKLLKRAYKSFYLNPTYLIKALRGPLLRNNFSTAMKLGFSTILYIIKSTFSKDV